MLRRPVSQRSTWEGGKEEGTDEKDEENDEEEPGSACVEAPYAST